MKQTIQSSLYIFIGFVFALTITSVSAWTGNTATPPGNNAPAPLNVTSNAQYKQGALSLGTASLPTTGSILDVNGTIFGKGLLVNGAFQLIDGTEGEGKVLVSDADGRATWGETVTIADPINPDTTEWRYANGDEDYYSNVAERDRPDTPKCDPVTPDSTGVGFYGTCPAELTGDCKYRISSVQSSPNSNYSGGVHYARCVAREALFKKTNLNVGQVSITGDGIPNALIYPDSSTLNRICQIKGYDGYYSFSRSTDFGAGPGRTRWIDTYGSASQNSFWQITDLGGYYLTALTCYRN